LASLLRKKAIVMCGSSGIGFGIASQLKMDGADVGITGRDLGRLKDAQHKSDLNQIAQADHGVASQTQTAIASLSEKLGGLDILVIHSPPPPKGLVESVSLFSWADGFQKITLSAIEAIQAALPHLKHSTSPRIIFILSTAAREPIPGMLVSTTLRSGMLGLMKSLSRELATHQITVNAVLPGYTRTDDPHVSGKNAQLESLIPLQRLAEPFEHGKLVSFLASDGAAYLTGQTIALDGGLNKGI
jgi:3-oxoacyl-[acyl-carrier protein] reductase